MMRLLAKVRLIPVTIFFAVLLLSVKVGSIWHGVDGLLHGSVAVAAAGAQQPGAAAPASTPTPAPSPGGEPAVLPEGFDAEQGFAGAPPHPRTMADDPTLLTQAEIDLLQQLAERRETLDARQRELDTRAGLIEAAELRLQDKVEELKRLQTTIEGLIAKYDGQQEAKVQSLVKIYENMKPKEAARIFEELEMDTLLLVAERMKERKLAAVMAKMNAGKAKEMTVELARLRQLPRAPGGGNG